MPQSTSSGHQSELETFCIGMDLHNPGPTLVVSEPGTVDSGSLLNASAVLCASVLQKTRMHS